jgi:hypothetical protein
MDEHWVRCYPYEQEVRQGETAQLRVEITNHSSEPRTATAQPILPPSWGVEIASAETTIPPKTDGYINFSIPIPQHCEGLERIVVPMDIIYNARPLGQFREAILVLIGG